MKYLFIVQGEGRGHMTQAISMSQILRESGHEICRVLVGKSERRKIPQFFIDKIEADIELLESPNFITDKNQKSVKPVKTIIHAVLGSKKYVRSINRIDEIVKQHQPDVIVNFYDFLGGIYNFLKRPSAKYVCLAHQFLMGHPEFDFPPKRQLDKKSLEIANKIVSLGADKILALSFQPFKDVESKNLFVVPPLLRQEIGKLNITKGQHLLVYMLNPGYAVEVDEFHQKYPDIPLHCFWDKKDAPTELKIDNHLTYHQLNDEAFIRMMASSRGYVTTAGFESVCEAMYLGKPVLMVPVRGHYEQACNAIDAKKAGAGIYSDSFDIEKLIEYLPDHKDISNSFRTWADTAPEVFLKMLK
ncbi:MAG: glycosyltransferase family protein [Bacteroidota bacterium]